MLPCLLAWGYLGRFIVLKVGHGGAHSSERKHSLFKTVVLHVRILFSSKLLFPRCTLFCFLEV